MLKRGQGDGVDLSAADLGADAFLCCPGPSLASVDAEQLKRPGVFVFALNTAYPKIRPDVWIGMDLPCCYDHRLWWEPFIKIARSGYQHIYAAGKPIKDCPRVYFAEYRKGQPADVANAGALPFIWNRNTFLMALHVMVYMGAKRIYLVGADFGGGEDYHNDVQLSQANRRNNLLLMQETVGLLPSIREAMGERGIELISATPGSAANTALPFVPLGEALKRAAMRVPSFDAPLLHSRDAELTKWRHPRELTGEQGVLVGTDEKQEWLLDWWWRQYREHNDYPVAFADFGMSQQGRAWCRERGEVLPVQIEIRPPSWWKKPFAILRSPFRQTLWIDLDCEVRGDVGKLLERGRNAMGIAVDTLATIRYGTSIQGRIFTSGVLSVRHGNPVVPEWARLCLTGNFENGDQHALSAVLREIRQWNEIKPDEHWVNFDGPNDGALIFHWGGKTGKEYLRRIVLNDATANA